ncbi:MAG: carbohydrate-binding domain-containing protein [Clostridia bacterium]|nr:carbohydrate-binding domain-containing protein [Clostridia bacterium]
MKRLSAFIILFALLCAACGGRAQTGSDASTSDAATGIIVTATADASEGSTAAATAAPETEPLTDPTDDSKASTDDFSVTSDADAITPDGAVYTITAAGEYTLSGALSDGQIVVDAGDDDEVKLNLTNASVSCSFGAPILIRNAAEVSIKAEKDTYNTVTDLRTGSAETVEEDAAIFAACDLKLLGKGTLIVETAFDNGVKSKDDLSVKNLTLKVTATGNALKGNDSVTIKSGSLILISTASDGVKTENSDVSSKDKQRGTVTISGGQVDIYAACDGISAAYNVEISEEETCAVNIYTATYADSASVASGAETYLIVPTSLYSDNADYCAYLYNDDESAGVWVQCTYESMVYSGRTAAYYGLVFRVPDGYRNILIHIVPKGIQPDGANYTAATTGETLNTAMNGYLITSISDSVISGDWVQLTAGNGGSNKTTFSSKGVKAENEIIIDGGSVTIFAMDDGLHANGGTALENGADGVGNITINGGSVTVTAADDGMHADGSLTVNNGTVNVVESHEGLEANLITQNGGTVYVYGDDDGLNACKGAATPMITINGGYAEIRTPSGDTDAIDSNGSFLMTGGTVLVLGGAQMGGMAGSVDTDGTVTVTGGTIVALGGICQLPQSGSVNTYVSNGTSFSAGEYRITDASGKTIFSFTLSDAYSSCWIASEAFALSGSYAVEKDGTVFLSWTQSSATEGSSGNYGFGGGFGGHGRR